HAEHDVAERGFRILHVLARLGAVGGDHHALMLAGAERIDRENRRAFIAAVLVDRLANDRAVAGHAGMADGGNNRAVDAREDHRRVKVSGGRDERPARPRPGGPPGPTWKSLHAAVISKSAGYRPSRSGGC